MKDGKRIRHEYTIEDLDGFNPFREHRNLSTRSSCRLQTRTKTASLRS